jgi:hypothetical protein
MSKNYNFRPGVDWIFIDPIGDIAGTITDVSVEADKCRIGNTVVHIDDKPLVLKSIGMLAIREGKIIGERKPTNGHNE